MNKDIIYNELKKIINPYTKLPLDMENNLKILEENEEKLEISYLEFGTNDKINKDIKLNITKVLKLELGYKFIKITPIKIEEKTTINTDTKIIAIGSGKGGVGKTHVAVNIAKKLQENGKKVGLVDCDIYGYTIPKMLDVYEVPKIVNEKIQPVETKEGIKLISIQYFLENLENQAVMWRVSMLGQILNNFFIQTTWEEELDYIIIDLPSGSCDVILDINKYVSPINYILVTTSDEIEDHVAIRGGQLAKELNFNILGVVENNAIANSNHGQLTAQMLDTKLLVKIPRDEINLAYEHLITQI